MQQGNGLQSPLRPLSVLFFHLLLAHSCTGQSQIIAPSQPIVAKVGDDIILPCHLEPEVDVVAMTLEWTRSDLNPRFVHMRRASQDLVRSNHPSYKGRTSVSIDELKNGNVSLKLSKVKPSDAGRYQCYIPKLNTGSVVELVVGAASSLVISLSEIDRNKGAVVLQCESTGWYPEPEVFWLDGEGNLLSAGPTETVRGPDDLYTVSSRVTVEKRHSNSFTCRVQQNHTNQIRETFTFISDDFFEVQSSSSSTTVGLAVSLAVCILVILILVFVVWKWRQNKIKTKRSQREEAESQQLMTENLQEEKQRREKAEAEVLKKKQELQDKTDEMEGNNNETIRKLLQERRDKEEAQREVRTLKDQLKSKNREWENKFKEEENKFKEEEKKRKKAEEDMKKLKTELETKVGRLTAEVNELKEEKRRSEKDRQELQTNIKQWEKKVKVEEKKRKKAEEDMEKLKRESEKQISSSQSSTTEPAVAVKFDPCGKYIQLKNTSTEDQQLGGWDLQIQVNDSEPIKHTFKDSFSLKPGKLFTVGCRGYSRSYPSAQLVLEDLIFWNYGDKLQVSLISDTGNIQYNLDHKY